MDTRTGLQSITSPEGQCTGQPQVPVLRLYQKRFPGAFETLPDAGISPIRQFAFAFFSHRHLRDASQSRQGEYRDIWAECCQRVLSAQHGCTWQMMGYGFEA
ncbi:hypothetical protein NEUTE2DRAFT_126184 [Neurospora tetrasperma FGSC 2509]|nr:hypothetical protein NEUTE2DRAFT_126184 [Neurospora tetrasperma FGSC 2509]